MTIVTKPLTAVKEDKKEAEEALVDVKVEQPIEEADLQLESVAVTSRVRRLHQHNLAFLALCLGFISLIGFMAGVHLYKSMFMKRCLLFSVFHESQINALHCNAGCSATPTGCHCHSEILKKTHLLAESFR